MLIPYTVESYLFVGANVRGLSNKNYVVSWVTGLVHYDARQLITLLNALRDVSTPRMPRTLNPYKQR